MLQLCDVSFSYAETEALSHIDLHVRQGEAVALVGPNGCGKSTALKMLNGLALPDNGSYAFDGEEVTERKLRDKAYAKRFHQRIGFLFQNPDSQLFCPVVYDDIAFGPRQMGFSEEEVEARVLTCLDLLDIGRLRQRIPYQLSEGEKRKVALAGVLALNPEVLTLDEPMNGLDPKTKRFLRDFLFDLKHAGKTIVCATHDFAYLDGVFDKAVVFSGEHRVIRTGCYGEIMADRSFLEEHNIL